MCRHLRYAPFLSYTHRGAHRLIEDNWCPCSSDVMHIVGFIVCRVYMQREGGNGTEEKSEHKTNGWYACKNVTDKRLSGGYHSVAFEHILGCFADFSVFSFSHFSLLPLFSWPYIQHLYLFKNTKQIIDNDCHRDPMWSCCKAGVILITYASRDAKRHGGPKAAWMRCEPLCLMANAPLWSALWNPLTQGPQRLYAVWFRRPCHRPC